MHSPRKPFFSLTAQDLMSREVVVIRQEMSLQAAARVLSRARITGAPVVDAAGVCVGVVSATDFLRLANSDLHVEPATYTDPQVVCSDWQMLDIQELPVDEVRRHMTPDPVTARPETPVSALAGLMRDAHIHRVIVVDAKGCPIGVVSSIDLISAVAQAEPAEATLAGSAN